MATARRQLVDLNATHFYHCMARCVRKAYLCGEDIETGRSFDHRKIWIVDRIKFLAEVFAIDICAYAVLSDHYHVVLNVAVEREVAWSDTDIIARWKKIFPSDAMAIGASTSSADEQFRAEKIALWRERLTDISWFMRCVNEYVARRANKEDRCKGRFWEGRFKCQSLLDESALLTCMAFVDLNPIRTGIATTIQASEFTSIYERIEALQSSRRGRKPRKRNQHEQLQLAQYDSNQKLKQPERIAKLNVSSTGKVNSTLPYDLVDYINLLAWTAASFKQASFPPPKAICKILDNSNINSDCWVASVKQFSKSVYQFLGSEASMDRVKSNGWRRKIKGLAFSRQLFNKLAA